MVELQLNTEVDLCKNKILRVALSPMSGCQPGTEVKLSLVNRLGRIGQGIVEMSTLPTRIGLLGF